MRNSFKVASVPNHARLSLTFLAGSFLSNLVAFFFSFGGDVRRVRKRRNLTGASFFEKTPLYLRFFFERERETSRGIVNYIIINICKFTVLMCAFNAIFYKLVYINIF